MTNQSFLSVPPNIDDHIVLRRYLSRLVEQLDIVVGNRSGTEQSFASKEDLQAQAEELTNELNQARSTLEQSLDNIVIPEVEQEDISLNTIYGVVTGIEQVLT